MSRQPREDAVSSTSGDESLTLPSDPRAGTELLGYRVEGVLGRGGMSVVYLAEDLHLKRLVALKLLAPTLTEDEAFRACFLEESQLAASLDHPNVVPIYAAGEAGDELFIAMRYVEGRDLKVLLRAGALDSERTIRICSQVGAALDFAHERGLVHRDVKPSNVLLDANEHVYLADFGLSKRLDGRAVEPALFGTIDYIAPEQIRGEEIDGRADVYALGCLLYECLVGSSPFRRGSDAATLFAHLEDAPPPLPGLDDVLSRALAKQPGERQETCNELIAQAGEALGIAVPLSRRSRWPPAAGAAVVAAVAAALLAVLLTGGGSPTGLDGRLLRIDPASDRVTDSIRVGDGAEAVAVGSGRVWVASYRAGTLWQVDPRGGGATSVPAFGRPHDVTVHAGKAYVAALGPVQYGGNITQFDAVSAGRTGGLTLPTPPCSVTSGIGGVWIAGCPDVYELGIDGGNVETGAKVPIPYPARLTAANDREALGGMAIGEGAVWVIGDASDPRLWRIDPGRHRVVSTTDLGFPPAKVAVGAGRVWVTDQVGDRLVEIDPRDGRVVRSIPVGRGAGGVAVGAGSVWVTGALDHTLTRVDPSTGRVTDTISLDASPQAVAVGDGSIWIVGDAR
jgi:streptogramin lyase/predicted Ser/Thr protein kinase